MTEEEKLVEKLRRIEALFARPGTEGEKGAALSAMERIKARLREFEKIDPPIEYKFSLPDIWSHQVMMALLQRYGAKPYRYSGQRRTTIMAKISRRFVHETLMPEFDQLHSTLMAYLHEVTERVIHQVWEVDPVIKENA